MGSCVSSTATSSVPAATAKLILMDGSILEFSEVVRSQEILQEYPGHFICNSDGLYAGRNISQVLRDDDQLQIGQLYFLLPQRKLQFVLTDSDMASLLFKISTAWQSAQKKKRQSRRLSCGFVKAQAQVQPFFNIHSQPECGPEYHSSSVCCLSRRPNIPISTDRQRLQYQPMLETIVETV
uniref:DUF4228 domain-containing protein n=1 Tax=Picea sitchensis TaxID=3332 RepID=A9NMA6_PICSI|nr:unknown [Picea sitchensis]